MKELNKEKPALCPIKDLDVTPQLLSRHLPVFPSALVGKVAEGQVTLEFLIDHYGNVQLPRVVSATNPAFGYAAMQGASAWKFAPPTSHGKPVNARSTNIDRFHHAQARGSGQPVFPSTPPRSTACRSSIWPTLSSNPSYAFDRPSVIRNQ